MEVEAKWRARISEGPPDSPWPQQEPRSTWQDSKSAASPEQQDRLAELTLHELALELFALPVKNPVTVNVHVPMSTLLEVDHRAGHLEGIGAIPAQHCRMLAVSGSLRRLNVSPRSDAPLGADPDLEVLPPLVTEEQLALTTAPDQQPDRLHVLAAQTRLRLFGLLGPAGPQDRAEPGHDPSPALGRQVDTRIQYCTGIGCNQSAGSCDRDHSTAWPTGPTAAWNLTVKGPRCHHLKHQGWTPSTDPHGWHHWQSPLGQHLPPPRSLDRPTPATRGPHPARPHPGAPTQRHLPAPTPPAAAQLPQSPRGCHKEPFHDR